MTRAGLLTVLQKLGRLGQVSQERLAVGEMDQGVVKMGKRL
ncbi:hypothetical protein CBM2586_B130544 [Cupriavidus phytorum]|uniref:Uncharacterized protein n=1 Tax=Cupriavidus taiwanensis TaxID=164546 RepID=A0A976AAP0_9BURK|nr:hypothetical protein CBM2586_B130544 [Cupriavidus taiwanensis]